MDKNDAIKISKAYLRRVQESNLPFSEAWLFGSYAKGNQHDDSDIDIAIVLHDSVIHTFETDVRLMTIRQGDETLIEPHAFTKDEFIFNSPIIDQIIKYGVKIEM